MKMRAAAALFVGLGVIRMAAPAADTNSPVTPAPKPAAALTNAISSFRLPSGFRIEVAASEPMVAAPVAMAFDENGRLFVVETRDDAAQRTSAPRLGRVRLLEDPDEDGVYRTSKIYADGLSWPSAVACYGGGVFVAATPDILFLKDSKGDGVADLRRVVISGFGGTNAVTARRLVNSFNWSLDNRIYGAAAGLGGSVTASNWPSGRLTLGRRDFSFDPRSLAVFPEAGPSDSGTTFDQRGRKFSSDFARPLRLAMYRPLYLLRDPFFVPAPELVDVIPPGAPAFHRVESMPAGKGGPTNVWTTTAFHNAQGCLVYRGSLFPTNWLGNAFIPCPDAHAVHRAVLRANGLGVAATRAPEDRTGEFLLSADASFYPVQAVAGPDGALYVVDRQTAPERGRIYRIVPDGFKHQKPPQLAKARVIDLVSDLASPDGWHRDTAARLLYEKQPVDAAPLLTNMLTRAKSPQARVQALHTLAGLGALQPTHLLRALRDPDELVREHGLKVLGDLYGQTPVSDEIWAELVKLTDDSSAVVRLQLAFALGAVQRPQQALALSRLLARDPENRWMQTAVLSSTPYSAGSLFAVLGGNAAFRNSTGGFRFLEILSASIGLKGQQEEVGQVVELVRSGALDSAQALKLAYALGEGLKRTGSSLGLADPQGRLQPLYRATFDLALNSAAAELARVDAVRFIGVAALPYTQTGDWLLALCNPQPLPQLRAAAVAALGNYDDPGIAAGLIERWGVLTPELRHGAVVALLQRGDRWRAVVEALAAGRISPADFSFDQLNELRASADATVQSRALPLLGPVPGPQPELVARFMPALKLKGGAARGRDIFQARCSDCHALAATDQRMGPDLAVARLMDAESLLRKILAPNAGITPGFETALLTTRRGEIRAGIVAEDNENTLTLKGPEGATVWPRVNVDRVDSRAWSLMPDYFGLQLSPQDLADLLEFLHGPAPR